MNDKDFMKLVEPVNMLIGYAQSANYITAETDLNLWKARLVYLADDLAKTWDEVIGNISNVRDASDA